ncbi:MAG: asparagine synthase C-terminal domain-containing protein, partial [Desulfuromonadales bacterium]|nr:asparagine synthase C-terminal domain-containing protein [Desulfuromonadales bacterium]
LTDAIRLRLRADVPVGAYLSGGLDSSIITSLIANNFNNNLRTFSLSFQTSDFDESTYQNEMVSYLGTNHSGVRVSNRDVRDNLSQVVWQCEKPLLRTGPVPLFSLSKLVRDNQFKVVLTGEGADEIFGGYNIFKEAKLRQFWGRQPNSKWRPLLVERLYPYIFKNSSRGRMFLQQFFSVKSEDMENPYFSHQVRWRNTGKNTNFFSTELQNELSDYDPYSPLLKRLPESFASRNSFSKTQFLEMDIFLSNYLLSSQGDRVGMGNSIELRVPFLDHRLIEFAAKLPPHWKIKGLNEKYILKEAFKGDVPENIRQRPKQPYRAPIKESFLTDETGSFIQDYLADDAISRYGYFDPKKVSFLRKKFTKDSMQTANEVQNMALIGILSTQILHKQFIEDFKPEKIEPAVPNNVIRRVQ